jgi:hypothetical protein
MISHRQHLLVAAMIWIMVGMMLTIRGVFWVVTAVHPHRFSIPGFLLVIALGALKGRFILSRTAARVISRIQQLDRHSPLLKVYSIPMYLTIFAMVGIGIACRWIGGHWHIYWVIGYLYTVVGIALLTGSSYLWRAWHSQQAAAY